ncbi:MAG: diguanylate cyclase [Clostridiales bacterium]|jgi:diguanylate cyclase (GGDEF)-like protein|nr:diguanylate cyclase [Clostridiales bacterium]
MENTAPRTHHKFEWEDLGDIKEGRGDLGEEMPVLVYRLMQYTMLDVLSREFGPERANDFFRDAGYIAGQALAKNTLNLKTDFDSFWAELQQTLQGLKIGILRMESFETLSGKITLTVGQDLDCSGLPVTNENVCNYDEGFISGILESYTGRPYEVIEVDCWANGDRVCRFEGVTKDEKPYPRNAGYAKRADGRKEAIDYMFDYLRDVFYRPNHARMDYDRITPDLTKLAKGLEFFVYCVTELRAFSKAIAKGDLNSSRPSAENELASSLKDLHATLKHLTWQTQQVAKGDYSQRVDYLGDFAVSFNTMTKQLDERYKDLKEEIKISNLKSQQLEQSNDLFEIVTKENSQWMVVVDKQTGEWLFHNYPVTNILITEDFMPQLRNWIESRLNASYVEGQDNDELELAFGGFSQYFSVMSRSVTWHEHDSVMFMLTDISADHQFIKELETAAYYDNLTGLYNREYGMRLLSDLIMNRYKFVLIFVDMDKLKYVNDKFGHLEGDRYINAVATALRGFSPSVAVCRLGGDEFMLLEQGWTEGSAAVKLEELRNQLIRHSAEGDALYEHSISYGVVDADEYNELDASQLLAIVDERMYAYKQAHKMERKI